MRALMRSLAPTGFEDVAALIALYRPGPMAANMHYDYADRKNGRKPIEYLHPDVEDILADTQGLMIYQESMMRVAQKLAGYSYAELAAAADRLSDRLRFMPSMAELIEELAVGRRPELALSAESEWQRVMSSHGDASRLSEAGAMALRAVGGWRRVGFVDERRDLPHVRKAFIEAFEDARRSQIEAAAAEARRLPAGGGARLPGG